MTIGMHPSKNHIHKLVEQYNDHYDGEYDASAELSHLLAALPLAFLFGFDALKQLHYTGRLNLASGVYSLLDEKAKAKIQKKHLLFIPCKTESGG